MKLRTKLSKTDCQTRLRSATELPGMALSWDVQAPVAVLGDFRGTAFRLHTGKYYSNSFAPFFYGILKEADGGTTIEGGFRMNPFVRLFLAFWLSFLLIFAVGAIMVPAPAHPALGVSRGWLYAILGLLAVLGVGLVQLGKWLGRNDEKVIHSFLVSTLEAGDESV
jgi:hypothetical protein